MSLLFCCGGEGWGWIESWVGTAEEMRLPVVDLGHMNLLSFVAVSCEPVRLAVSGGTSVRNHFGSPFS